MRKFAAIIAAGLVLAACSTTRVLEEGQYRLTRNYVKIDGGPDLAESDVTPYIRQSSQGWNPFICVYNWSLKDGIFHKLGRAPQVFDPSTVPSSEDNIRTHLEYLGYYGSRVTSHTKYSGRKVHVYYDIRPGKRYRIDSLCFDVPAGGTFPEDFYPDTAFIASRLLGRYLSEDLLEQESRRSASRMRNLGYFDFGKNNYSFVADSSSDGTTSLVYKIRGYTRNEVGAQDRPIVRYRLGSVDISRPEGMPFREKVLLGLNTLRPRDVYSESEVNKTYSRFSSLRVFSSVQVEMTPTDSSKVDCDIFLSRSPVQGFKVKMEGSTNSSGLLGISPEFSYYHKNIFHGGEWLNLGFSGDFQYRPSDNTRATEYGISGSLSFPKLLFVPYSALKGARIPRTELNAAFNYQDRPEYNRSVLSTGIGCTGVTKGNISYQLYPLRIGYVRLFNLDNNFAETLNKNPFMRYTYQDHLDAGVSANFYYNSSTDIVPKGGYKFRKLTLDVSGNLLSIFNDFMTVDGSGSHCIAGAPYSQYVRGEYSWGKVWSYGAHEKQAIALRLLAGAGYAYGNSAAMPFEKQFYAGGASSMRGWQARALGPGSEKPNSTFIIPSQTGDMKLEANLEYRFGMFWKLEGALFADVGNVWHMVNGESEGIFRFNDFYKSIAADWGLGLRINLDFILLRLDFGMQLYNPSREAQDRVIGPERWLESGFNAFHFGVGYPF